MFFISPLGAVPIDSEPTYSVDKVKVWHYALDGRTYNGTKTQVSVDGTNWVTVFDSAVSGTYAETAAGRTTTFTAQSVRYVRDYLNGSNVTANGRIAQATVTQTAYFLGDALGSVRHLVDSAGQVTLARSYEPYGDVLTSVGSGVTSYSFTGEWRDGSGLVYLRARYYASGVGRFTTRDTWPGEYSRPLTRNG